MARSSSRGRRRMESAGIPGLYASRGSLEASIAALQNSRTDSKQPPHSSACNRLKHILQRCGNEPKPSPAAVSRLYAFMREAGIIESSGSLGDHLVSLLVHAGKLSEAEEALGALPYRTEFSWTALISAYVKCGKPSRVFFLYCRMQEDAVRPSGYTFVALVKAAIRLKDVEKALSLHRDICKAGQERDLFVGSALVDMYVRFDMLNKAEEVFEELLVRDAVSWNSLISGYSRLRQGEKSLRLYEHMQLEGVSPTVATFVCILKACTSIGECGKGEEIHAKVSGEGLETNLIIANTLINMYGSFGFLTKAHEVFEKLTKRDVVTWTSLISGCAKHGHGEEALDYFVQMCLDGISPDVVALVYGVKACGIVQDAEKGHDLHEIIKIMSLESNPVVGNVLVDMYVKCGMLDEAHELLGRLPERDVITWNALIGGYAKQGLSEKTFSCVDKMVLEGCIPDAITYGFCFKVCGAMGAIERGQIIHYETINKGFLNTDVAFGNALIDMYAKCGLLEKAQEVFNSLPARDLISWNALIAGYAQKGESENVFRLVSDRMVKEQEYPNVVTFGSMLNACTHAGLLAEGQACFLSMMKDFGLIPTTELYTCLIDLISRAGQLDNALWTINALPIQPPAIVWNTLHGACQKWSDIEIGQEAFQHVLGMNENDSAAYVCMHNIYADSSVES